MKPMPTPTESKSDTRQGDGRLPQPVRLAVIDMSRFIECLPADVRKKLSLHDIRRVCDNYRKRPCGECHLKPGETCDICGAVEKPNSVISNNPPVLSPDE